MKVQLCTRCGRANPLEAQYCHHDGLALGAGAGDTLPLDAGAVPLLMPFVFPSGRFCRTFDELVLAAEDLWKEAQEFLDDGTLAAYLGGIGRADLARLARERKDAPDRDRALNDFLNYLPSSSRQPPALRVQPAEFNLGIIARSDNRRLILCIENTGMGLLCGNVSSVDSPWLVLGDPQGATDKVFQCRRELVLPLQLLAERTPPQAKSVEGKIVIESNGGTITLLVQAEVTVRPFPAGVLAGAVSPRQLAEKARAAPKEAAPLFETGAVKKWYGANGWPYPVQGPQALGLGGVQQFFEALGLSTPPRVDISDVMVKLQGNPGDRLEYTLEVKAQEDRAVPVFAHASSSADWLRVGKVSAGSRAARVHLHVPAVPEQPGESLLGRVEVVANGGKRFTVAVALKIAGTPRVEPDFALGLAPVLDPSFVVALNSTSAELPEPVAASGLACGLAPEPTTGPVVATARNALDCTDTTTPSSRVEPEEQPPRPSSFVPRPYSWRQLVTPLLILLVLTGAVVHDATLPDRKAQPGPPIEPPPAAVVLEDNKPHLALRVLEPERRDGRFGLVLPREKDPNEIGQLKRLTFDEWGRSNNTCLRIDGVAALFGGAAGKWVERYQPLDPEPGTGRLVDGFRSVWRVGDVRIRQHVEIVPGQQSRYLDTCLVHYTLENMGDAQNAPTPRVGLRFLLDSYIGSVDGVPWTVPGQPGLCETKASFDGPAVPDCIECLEREDLRNPGAVVRVQARLGGKLEPPSRLLLAGWPHLDLAQFGHPAALGHRTLWDVPAVPMRELYDRVQALLKEERVKPEAAARIKADSAVTLYWDEKPLGPGARREIGFAYGLNKPVSDQLGKLLLSTSGRFVPGGEMTVTALVSMPEAEEKLTLTLPAGFELLPGNRTVAPVPAVAAGAARNTSVVTWRLKAGAVGKHEVKLGSSGGATVQQAVIIYPAREAER